MNCGIMTGYLTADPITNRVKVGDKEVTVTNFTIAVRNSFGEGAEPEFVRVNAWRGLGDSCAKYLSKGRRVEVRGPIHLNTYINKYGQPGARLELRADMVEFSGANPNGQAAEATATATDLPFEED